MKSLPLPERPSLDSLKKQAKKLARDVDAGDADAIARVRAHLARADLPFTQRNAQLVIAREYGFAGWQELTAEVSKRLGNGLAWAVAQAKRAIHDTDIERLKQLLAEYPALLSWRDDGGLLHAATGAYGDASTPERERSFTRAECAELLIDAGAVVVPDVPEGLLRSRARGVLHLFHRKGLLPKTLKFVAALGDLDAVRNLLADDATDLDVVNEAFIRACGFHHEAIALLLLDRSIALDPALGTRVDGGPGRAGFARHFIDSGTANAIDVGLWNGFVIDRITRSMHDRDLAGFIRQLQEAAWLLGDAWIGFQNELIGTATYNGRGEFVKALFDLDPAILHRQPPPVSQTIEYAATYGQMDLLPLLTRIWPVPDDLPYAAALGDFARVKQWFDDSGAFAPGDLDDHYPYNDPRARSHLHWFPARAQQVLDVALAFAVINRHFEIADFLLAHGANINTDWNSHEPASILHHLVFLEDSYSRMQYLIDRGIDMTIKDYRWNSNARGWAMYGKGDEAMAQWLEEEERKRAAAT